jgi:hypothetical protein
MSIVKKEKNFWELLKKLNENYPHDSVLKAQHLSVLLERFFKDFHQSLLTLQEQQWILSIIRIP